MEQKNTKVYLPSTYEQFLQQKKKMAKPNQLAQGSKFYNPSS